MNKLLQNKLKDWKGEEKKKKVVESACQFWNAHCMTEDSAMTYTIPYT